MSYKDNYTNEANKTKQGEENKIVLSNDTFAVVEAIDRLTNRIERSLKAWQ